MLGNASRILEPLILFGSMASCDLLTVSKGSELFSLPSLSVGLCPRYLSHAEQPQWKRENGQRLGHLHEDISLAGLT